MILATQYYRPPFPEKKYWKEDLDNMKKANLNALQLWVLWGWVEPEPGVFKFDDYDELFEEARKRDLKVVLSSIAEIQPFWIHREIPDAYMIDHAGNKVLSSLRKECNQGLTPGGCTDHPEVKARMKVFFEKLAERYADHESLIGWDCWNELRWNVNSYGLVCHCDHTVEAFRNWLKSKYGDLDGLNRAWNRRYCSWQDVYPGKRHFTSPYTEMVEFEKFILWKHAEHVKFRYETLRSKDKKHIITAHGANPSIETIGDHENHAINRGNDWDLADHLDGLGCSHFPFWFSFSDDDFGIRVEQIRSAAQGKEFWVSELQGGSARKGFGALPSVEPLPQQRWIWNGYGRGAKKLIFWCWRDEIFGSESSGFGIVGHDGFAEQRLEAIKKTGEVLKQNNDLFDAYKPDKNEIGILFEPENYLMEWAQDCIAKQSSNSIKGYAKALERLAIPYDFIEGNHLDNLDNLKLLIMPWSLIVRDSAREKIRKFVENGGTVLVEAEADSFTSNGFYRYPGEDRDLAMSLKIHDLGRRMLEGNEVVNIGIDDDRFLLKSSGWITPFNVMDGKVIASSRAGEVLGLENKVGKGTVFAVGTFFGQLYSTEQYPEFERFVKKIVEKSDVNLKINVISEDLVQWRSGMSGLERLLFITNPKGTQKVKVEVPKALISGSSVVDLFTNEKIEVVPEKDTVKFEFTLEKGSYKVFKWE